MGASSKSWVIITPIPDPIDYKLDLERIQYWMSKGAKPSETVRKLIERATVANQAS